MFEEEREQTWNNQDLSGQQIIQVLEGARGRGRAGYHRRRQGWRAGGCGGRGRDAPRPWRPGHHRRRLLGWRAGGCDRGGGGKGREAPRPWRWRWHRGWRRVSGCHRRRRGHGEACYVYLFYARWLHLHEDIIYARIVDRIIYVRRRQERHWWAVVGNTMWVECGVRYVPCGGGACTRHRLRGRSRRGANIHVSNTAAPEGRHRGMGWAGTIRVRTGLFLPMCTRIPIL